MYKKIILNDKGELMYEDTSSAISSTKKIQKDSGKINKDYYKDVKNKMEDYEEPTSVDATPVKTNIEGKTKEYHDEMEIRNGMEMLKYDNKPSDKFTDRAEKSLTGDSTMGNKTYVGEENGNTEEVWNSSGGKNTGEEILKQAKDSMKKRNDAEYNLIQFGDDIEQSNDKKTIGKARKIAVESFLKESILADENYTHFAINKNNNKILEAWNYSDVDKEDLKSDSNHYFYGDLTDFDYLKKSDIKIVTRQLLEKNGIDINNPTNWERYQQESITNTNNINENTMKKRLRFKNPINGINNALRLIPEHYKVDDKEFEMTDGNETYNIRWEGSLTEGRALILNSTSVKLVSENMTKMKHLMNFNSKDTLGILTGEERIAETKNHSFRTMLDKTRSIIKESEEMESLNDEALNKPVNEEMESLIDEGWRDFLGLEKNDTVNQREEEFMQILNQAEAKNLKVNKEILLAKAKANKFRGKLIPVKGVLIYKDGATGLQSVSAGSGSQTSGM